MEKTDKMVEELTEKRKMTEEVKENLIENIFYNFLLALGIMCYISIVNVVHTYLPLQIYDIISKVLSIIAILITVGIFEFAYRKDSGKYTIYGIEILFFSIVVLYMPKMFTNLDKFYSQIFLLTPLFCAIYYVAKSIVIYKKTEKEYQNSLSDVKIILKEEIQV